MTKSVFRNSFLLMAIVLAVILIPFFIFHEKMDLWTEQLLQVSVRHVSSTITILVALLASDIFLPIPSSLVSTGAVIYWQGISA